MSRSHGQLAWIGVAGGLIGVLLSLGALICGCGKPGGWDNNFTNSYVTITSINNNEPFQSDVLTKGTGTDDVVSVRFKSDFRVKDDDPTALGGPTIFDTITFHTYQVAHYRSDGGANPASFSAGLNLQLPPDTDAEIKIVIVRAFDKYRSPLRELQDDGEIFTTSIVTFYGTDGNGNDLSVTCSMAISYGNFPDQ